MEVTAIFHIRQYTDGSCKLILRRHDYVVIAVAYCPRGCFPTERDISDCRRAMMGQPTSVYETC